jgi:OmpA family/MotA/TolQ/ExbB proton channel family
MGERYAPAKNCKGLYHRGATQPVMALSTMADSLPGLGIVAAVLGAVITMGALGGPPEQIGHKVAAALVGTFLGILLCYGLVGPVAANMAKAADEEHAFYNVLRVVMLAFLKGTSPIMAVEIGRRAPGPCAALFPGHTDAKPFARDSNYGNWELSVDRANAARRLMQQNGVKEDQVAQVRGYATTRTRAIGGSR